MLLILNAHHDLVQFTLPAHAGGEKQWTLLVDTNVPEEKRRKIFSTGEIYGVTGRSLLLLDLSETSSE
jgi:glycogen operon protein